MQDLAQRVTAIRPDLISADASYGELAWVWGKGRARYGATWPRRLWFRDGELVAWGWAFLPHQVRRNDGSVTDVTGASLSYQVHPGHTELTDHCSLCTHAGCHAGQPAQHCHDQRQPTAVGQ